MATHADGDDDERARVRRARLGIRYVSAGRASRLLEVRETSGRLTLDDMGRSKSHTGLQPKVGWCTDASNVRVVCGVSARARLVWSDVRVLVCAHGHGEGLDPCAASMSATHEQLYS